MVPGLGHDDESLIAIIIDYGPARASNLCMLHLHMET